MKKSFVLILIGLTVQGSILAQQFSNEINDQVWKPFMKALVEGNADDYLSLHSNELVRVERTNKKVYGLAEYTKIIKEGFQRSKDVQKQQPGKIEFTVEIRFLERTASQNLAYEVGYFKSKLVFPKGEERIYYSEFHVSLRKEDGRWKILTDASLPKAELKEEEFLKAQPVENI